MTTIIKLAGAAALVLVMGVASADKELVLVDQPVLTSPASLKTNKAGRVRFEVKTNCKSIVYLVDEDLCELDRVYTAPDQFLYKFSADNPGVFKIVFVAASGDIPLVSQTVITYEGIPQPGPGPSPAPTPTPGPGPSPGPAPSVTKLFIVVIEDTLQSKSGRGAYYANRDLLARVKGKGWQLRVEDKGVLNASGVTPPDLAPYIKAAAGKEPYVFLVNQDGRVLFEGALPDKPSDLLALIQKVGG